VAVLYRRLRDRIKNREIPLRTYQGLQQPHQVDGKLLLQIMRGLSCRSYGECAQAIPAVFGLSPSSGSRRFIQASARKLRDLCERPLDSYNFVALILDGKTFAEDEMIIEAYEKPTYIEARAALQRIRQELRLINVPSPASRKEWRRPSPCIGWESFPPWASA